MDDFETIRWFESQWPRLPKNTVFEWTADGETMLSFACQLKTLQVWLTIIIGKKGGIREQIEVFDPAQRITIDRLRLSEVTTAAEGNGYLLQLLDMRQEIRRGGQDALTICREWMEGTLKHTLTQPMMHAFINGMERKSSSVPTISGGLPGLGKRR